MLVLLPPSLNAALVTAAVALLPSSTPTASAEGQVREEAPSVALEATAPAPASAALPTTPTAAAPSSLQTSLVAAPDEADAAAPAGGSAPSPVPTLAEWNAQTREVTVSGSSALQCETKMVREWLRISCRGEVKNPPLGTPSDIEVIRGDMQRGDFFRFASGGVASLVFRFVQGTDVEANFHWTEATRHFESKWPYGAPMPQVKGRFSEP